MIGSADRMADLLSPGSSEVRLVRDAAAGSPPTPFDARDEEVILRCNGCLFADFANANHNLRFNLDADPPTFVAVRVGDLAKVDGRKLGPA